ncbi:MAG: hypothetical protein M0Q92_12870 [Methanoregula sp.]|jgi:hypothetical protein|nr:hypothetical protein [Methanoregula sp.]
MAAKEPVPGFLLVILSFIIALLLAVLVQPVTGRWDAVLFAIVLFFLLWVVATKRQWAIPHPLLFIRSTVVSDIFLGLLLTVIALAASWYIGTTLSRMYSDLLGIPVGLVVFGVIMLTVSASKKWE